MDGSAAKRGRGRGGAVVRGGRGGARPSPPPSQPGMATTGPSAEGPPPTVRPVAPSGAAAVAMGAGGGLSGPSFTNDILNHLPPPKRQEMLSLVARFRTRQIHIQEFSTASRALLGEKLYAVLAHGMNMARVQPNLGGGAAAAAAPLSSGSPVDAAGGSVGGMPVPHSSALAPAERSGGAASGEFDVNKLDSAALQDVIQYSGVDLRAEAEMIMRHDSHVGSVPLGRDPRMQHDFFLNGARLRALISAAVVPRGITDMSEDCLEMIALAAQRRLANVISQLAAISRHRADYGRASYKIKIDNDPKRQLWLVDQYMAAENERVRTGQGGFGSADALALARAKAKKAEKRASEDVAVKTKLANVTAAVATGLQQKSWMMDPSALAASLPDSSVSSAGAGASSVLSRDAKTMPLHFSQAASMTPVSDRELQAQFVSRTINLRDLVYWAENDPHMRHSTMLLSLYSQLGGVAAAPPSSQ